MTTDDKAVLTAIRINAIPMLDPSDTTHQRAYIPEVIRDSALSNHDVHQALARLETSGVIEQRTDDEVHGLPDADLEMCPISDDGWILVWAILKVQ